MRRSLIVPITLSIVLSSVEVCATENVPGGLHVAYALGGALAADGSGSRRGLDFALMPILFNARERILSVNGFTAGVSWIYGLDNTSSYLTIDAGPAVHSFIGGFLGAGAVYRFPHGARDGGCGIEGRIAFDVVFLEVGLRLMILGGKDSSEVGTLFSLGLGRF